MTICRKCGCEFEQSPRQVKRCDFQCLKCKAAWMREYRKKWNPANREKLRLYQLRYYPKSRKYEKLKSNPIALEKYTARVIAREAKRTGKLVAQPCEVCGTPKVDAHHTDYSKPLDVRWLCRPHHQALHRGELQ